MGQGDGSEGVVPDLVGVRLAEGYRILAVLSAGRVAAVYEAQRLHDGQRVVVKVLLPQFVRSRRHVERFLDSARVGASLRHPNIVQVLDCGRVPGGAVYFAREHLEGARMRRVLAERGAVPWALAMPRLAELLDALDVAHRQGVTHGGVEPARCWFSGSDGDPGSSRLVVTGFGLFGSSRDPWPVSEPYRAPELDKGMNASPGGDVFGVGAVAYELLSGMPWSKADHGVTTGLCELAPDVPRAVDRVITRALHPDPAQRHASATALLADFRAAAGLPVASERPPASGLAPTRGAAVLPPPVEPPRAAASFRYPPSPVVPVVPVPVPVPVPVSVPVHPTFDDSGEDEEEVTAVHDDFESRLPSVPAHAGAPMRVAPEGTVRLHGSQVGPASHEETVLLPADELAPPFGDEDDEPTANRVGSGLALGQALARPSREETTLLDPAELRARDPDWGTVVLPGGGHPQHFEDRTQLLAVDTPEEPSAAISITSMISVSLGAPEPVEAVGTASITGMGGARLRAHPVAIPMPVRGPVGAPGVWPMPQRSPQAAPVPPTGGYPVVSGPYPVVSGPYPVVSGPSPVVSGPYPAVRSGRTRPGARRPAPRGNPRRRPPPPGPTGAHPSLRAKDHDTTRMAWGFLVGVLIAVGIVGAAVVLAMVLSR